MAEKLKLYSLSILILLTTFVGSQSVCAQIQTEFKVNKIDSTLINSRPSRLKPIRRVIQSKDQKIYVEEENKYPDTPSNEKPFIPDPNIDPRHKLDSVSASVDTLSSNKNLIYLEHTEMMLFDADRLPDIQVLVGNVILRHDEAFLYCDSAHLNQKTNSFDAFGNVRIEQGDSVDIFANSLFYDGNTRIANLKNNVKLINGEVTLTTDVLTYDRGRKVGYYLVGGTLRDSLNTLVSKKGYYYTDSKMAEFKTDVVGYNDDNTIVSDTLMYNTESKIASILGPTTITHSDSSTIYSEYGWYDTENDLSQLLKNSVITHSEGKTLIGDSIFYDKKLGIGEAFSNVVITDTANSIILTGDYGYYREEREESLLTRRALMREYSQSDTTYIHADTLFAYQLPDSSKIVHLYYNCRLYNEEFQAIADSIYYTSADSVLHLLKLPVLWNEDWQITGDTILVFPTDGDMNRAHVKENSMIIQEQDTIHYNQMSGREFMAYIGDKELDSLHIMGNAESVFFPADGDKLIGLNKIQSSYMTIYFKEGKLDRLNVFPSPTANMYPMSQITDEMLHLPNFTWQIDARPISPADLFRRPTRVTQAELDEQKNKLIEKQKEERKRNRSKAEANRDGKAEESSSDVKASMGR